MASKKIQIPDINHYSQFQPFLDDFFKMNKEANKNFSYRFLAAKLGWSASHLNDVMQGRRFLSLTKLLELIDYLGLKGVRAERLLLLALFDSNGLGEKAKDFLALKNSSFNVRTMTQDQAKLLKSALLQNVLHYIISEDGYWNATDFIARSRRAKEISKTELTEIIRVLEASEMIRWNQDKTKYIVEKSEFYQDNSEPGTADDNFHTAQREYAKSYQEFLEDRFPAWLDLFGAVTIPRERLPEVFDGIAGLRNYLYEIRNQTLEKDPKAKFEVFKFSLTLFSVFRRAPKP